jgi:hypothetical protein
MWSHISHDPHRGFGKPQAMISLCKDIHCILLQFLVLSHQQWPAVNHREHFSTNNQWEHISSHFTGKFCLPEHQRKETLQNLVSEATHQAKGWSNKNMHVSSIQQIDTITVIQSKIQKVQPKTNYHETASFSLPPSVWYGASWIPNNIVEPPEMT